MKNLYIRIAQSQISILSIFIYNYINTLSIILIKNTNTTRLKHFIM
jgi:hypothetical protein